MHILGGLQQSSFNKLPASGIDTPIYQKVAFLHSSDGKAFPESSILYIERRAAASLCAACELRFNIAFRVLVTLVYAAQWEGKPGSIETYHTLLSRIVP
jgi:hypothetical protein